MTGPLITCRRCETKSEPVDTRIVSIGRHVYFLCKACSKRFDEVQPVIAVQMQAFLLEEKK